MVGLKQDGKTLAVDGQWIELETQRGGEGQGEKPEGQAVPLDCVGRMRVLARRQSQNCQKKAGASEGRGRGKVAVEQKLCSHRWF